MTPIYPRKQSRGASLRLVGDTCGHPIDVLVLRPGMGDERRILAAMMAKEPHALLDRLCPFCRVRRLFRFPLFAEGPKALPTEAPPLRYKPILLPPIRRDFVPPRELAFRLWESGRALMDSDPDQARLRLARSADIFDRERMWIQRDGAQRDLAKLASGQSEDHVGDSNPVSD